MNPVKDLNLRAEMSVKELIDQFGSSGGFTTRELFLASEILKEMINDNECVSFLSFPACIVATGARGVIRKMVQEEMIDVLVTTCGTLDHDLARVWRDYYHGSFELNDEELRRNGINRIGNVLVPNESYGLILERKMKEILEDIYYEGFREISTRELAWEIGKRLEKEERKETSIVYWCYKNRIPIFVQGITDGAVGSQIWLFRQERRDFSVNVFKDEEELSEIIFNSKRTGALIIGGGISKHHTIWWNQFKGGLDYVIYVTTAVEWDGSLSGARIKEAISWGKVSEKAKKASVYGDATLILPLMVSYVLDILGRDEK